MKIIKPISRKLVKVELTAAQRLLLPEVGIPLVGKDLKRHLDSLDPSTRKEAMDLPKGSEEMWQWEIECDSCEYKGLDTGSPEDAEFDEKHESENPGHSVFWRKKRVRDGAYLSEPAKWVPTENSAFKQ